MCDRVLSTIVPVCSPQNPPSPASTLRYAMDFQFLLAIPITAIIYMWHKSLPPLPPPTYPKYPHRYGSTSNGFMIDDSPWQTEFACCLSGNTTLDDNICSTFMDDSNSMSEIHMRTFEDDMFDPACSYLNYNIYHDNDDLFGNSDISGSIDNIHIND